MTISFIGEGSRRGPPIMSKLLVNFVTCCYESGAPSLVI